jgi:hypothetical protein
MPTRSLRQTNPSVAPAYPAKSLQPAAWVISSRGMIRGGKAELEREWIGVAGGRLLVLVALSWSWTVIRRSPCMALWSHEFGSNI